MYFYNDYKGLKIIKYTALDKSPEKKNVSALSLRFKDVRQDTTEKNQF